MTYEVEITPAAKRQIKKLTKSIQQLIVERLEELVDNPRPPGMGASHFCKNIKLLTDH